MFQKKKMKNRSTYNANLACLRRHASPSTVTEVVAAAKKARKSPLNVSESTQEGHAFDYAATGEDGRAVSLHSRRDPIAEADRKVARWLDAHPLSEDAVVVVFSMTCPYHLGAMARRVTASRQQLVLVDIRPDLVAAALPYLDLKSIGDSFRAIVSDDVERIWTELREFLGKTSPRPYCSYLDSGIARGFAGLYEDAGERLAWYAQMNAASARNLEHFKREWFEHSLLNMHAMLRSSPVTRLRNLFEGKPAVIVASGPSLDRHIETIRELQTRAVVIGVSSAIRPLVKAAIPPDFAVFLDSRLETRNQLSELSDSDLAETFLVAPISIQPVNISRFAGRRFLQWTLTPPGLCQVLGRFGVDGKFLNGGTTVTIAAIQLARYLGCDRGFTFGLDLAMGADKQQYCGNTFHGKKDDAKPKRTLMAVPGNWDETVWTTPTMAGFIGEIGLTLKDAPRTDYPISLLNVNDGGARIVGLQPIQQENLNAEELPPLPGKFEAIRACTHPEYANDDDQAAAMLEKLTAELRSDGKKAAHAAKLAVALMSPGENDDARLAQLRDVTRELQEHENVAALLEDGSTLVKGEDAEEPPPEKQTFGTIATTCETSAGNAIWIADRIEASCRSGGILPE